MGGKAVPRPSLRNLAVRLSSLVLAVHSGGKQLVTSVLKPTTFKSGLGVGVGVGVGVVWGRAVGSGDPDGFGEPLGRGTIVGLGHSFRPLPISSGHLSFILQAVASGRILQRYSNGLPEGVWRVAETAAEARMTIAATIPNKIGKAMMP